MVSMSEEFTLDLIIHNVNELIELVKTDSPIAREVVENAFITTKQSREIQSLNWKSERKWEYMRTFRSPTTILNPIEVQSKVCAGDQKSSGPNISMVTLQILSLRWLLQDNKWIGDFVKLFKQLDRESWFGHSIMLALFDTYMPEIKSCLIKRGLIPFMIYFASTFVFNYYSTISKYSQMSYQMTNTIFWTFGPIMLLSWAYFTYHEFLQMKSCF